MTEKEIFWKFPSLKQRAIFEFERVDEKGRVIGFAIFNFTRRDKTLVEVPLELEKIIA